MTVTVVFFAAAREVTGRDNVQLEVDEFSTVADVKRSLNERFPDLEPLLAVSNWSVDHQYTTEEQTLHPHAEIGLILPVSGG